MMLNFPIGEATEAGGRLVTGLAMGGNTLEAWEVEAVEVKLPLTSCSNDPRMDELPSELLPPSLLSDLLLALLSLLPLPPEAASLFSAACFRNLGRPRHCWM